MVIPLVVDDRRWWSEGECELSLTPPLLRKNYFRPWRLPPRLLCRAIVTPPLGHRRKTWEGMNPARVTRLSRSYFRPLLRAARLLPRFAVFLVDFPEEGTFVMMSAKFCPISSPPHLPARRGKNLVPRTGPRSPRWCHTRRWGSSGPEVRTRWSPDHEPKHLC